MRRDLLLLVSGLCLLSQNAFPEATTLNLSSQISYKKDLTKRFMDFPQAIDKVISNRALETLIGNESLQPVNALDSMSRIFISKSYGISHDRRIVFALAHMSIEGQIKYGKIYSHPKGYVLHLRTKESGDVALFFQGFSFETVSEINTEISRSMPKIATNESKNIPSKNRRQLSSAFNLFSLFIGQSAFAEEQTVPALCGGPVNSSSVRGTNGSILKNVWECTKGLGGGVWDSTGGAAWSVANGAYQVVMHPVETWNQASESFSKVQAMMSDLEGAFGELKSAYNELPDSVKWHLGCEIISSVGTTGLIAYLTLGSGSPLLLRTIAQALTKVAAGLPAGSASATRTLTLATKLTNKAEKMSQIETMISQGKEGKQFVDTLAKFKRELDDVWHEQASLETANYNAAVDIKNAGLGLKYSNITNGELFARDAQDVAKAQERLAQAKQKLDALQQQHSEFSAAVTKVLDGKGAYRFNDAGVKEKILQELAAGAGRNMTKEQMAAASAYLGVQACNLSSVVGHAVTRPRNEQEPAKAVQ